MLLYFFITCFSLHFLFKVLSFDTTPTMGEFWFPAQVYNRENGHVGFMLSCYDAELSYDSRTDTFQARYPPHGRRAVTIENNVPWEKFRAPPFDTSPHDFHFSDCLNELRPGDNIGIQWRRNKKFPYGWWYWCKTIALEFNQYTPGLRWRRTTNHPEEGNEAGEFYEGIIKLCSEEEISTWKRLWPSRILE
ncbi:hypothetical protein like AT2G32560 [Hibiscus trionum]|uniref:S-protein homolog n=1 Tax=Hibiscus trionum TaxID=183268 RepID=A0A9W7HQC9_HIBTR|nr:hypothetical protein like AT2G32560 [Hibiscus trionum]